MEIKKLSDLADKIKKALEEDDSINPEVRKGLKQFIDIAISKLTIQELLMALKPDNFSTKIPYCNTCKYWDNKKILNSGQCNSPKIRSGLITKANIVKTYEYFGCRYHEK